MNECRYIDNPFAKIFNIVNPDHNQLYNLLLKLLRTFFQDVKIPTVKANTSVEAKSEEDPFAYVGTGGYLVMFLRLHDYFSTKENRESELIKSRTDLVGDQGVNQLTDPYYYLKLAQEQYEYLANYIKTHKKRKDCYSFFMSQVSIWVCGMHIAYRIRNAPLFRQNQHRVLQCFEELKQNMHVQLWELLYGVPGFLYSVLELQKSYDKAEQLFRTKFGPIAIELTNIIVKEGISNYQKQSKTKVMVDKLPEDFRLVYHFHKKEYLGGAHGLGGNLNILLIAMKQNDFEAGTIPLINLIKASIVFLLRNLINGNFATSNRSNNIKLVHFCHGAPGIVTALAKFAQMFPEMGISIGLKEVIEVNLNHIWKYGVLKKGFGLCHGISGNAYTFISPSLQSLFHDRSHEFLKKAQFFALLHEEPDVMKAIRAYNFEDRMTVGRSDQPYSLMVGIAGDVCFTIDVLKGSGYFPGYDL